MKNPIWYVVDRYFGYFIRKSQERSNEIRQMQRQAHRENGKIQRYVIFEDLKSVGTAREMLSYTIRIVDGKIVRLPHDTKPDITVYLDIPALYGIVNNSTVIYPNGKPQTISPFTVWDGIRLGRIVWEGDTAVLEDMYLFDRKVLPLLKQELDSLKT